VHDLNEAIQLAEKNDYNEVMICGGGEIYKQSIGIANKILITRVKAVLDADTFFPEIDESEWKMVFEEKFEADARHAYDYSFQTWMKRS
jgi:dihydrofolate reductase